MAISIHEKYLHTQALVKEAEEAAKKLVAPSIKQTANVPQSLKIKNNPLTTEVNNFYDSICKVCLIIGRNGAKEPCCYATKKCEAPVMTTLDITQCRHCSKELWHFNENWYTYNSVDISGHPYDWAEPQNG